MRIFIFEDSDLDNQVGVILIQADSLEEAELYLDKRGQYVKENYIFEKEIDPSEEGVVYSNYSLI